jgi:hypothetical protein
MRKFTGARPVRFLAGQGWVGCLDHQAQRWQAVLADRVLNLPPYSQGKRQALALLSANVARHAPLPRNYKLGKEMGKRDASIS